MNVDRLHLASVTSKERAAAVGVRARGQSVPRTPASLTCDARGSFRWRTGGVRLPSRPLRRPSPVFGSQAAAVALALGAGARGAWTPAHPLRVDSARGGRRARAGEPAVLGRPCCAAAFCGGLAALTRGRVCCCPSAHSYSDVRTTYRWAVTDSNFNQILISYLSQGFWLKC